VTYDDAGSGGPGRSSGHDRQEGCLDRPPDPLPTRVDLLPTLSAAYDDAIVGGLNALGLWLAEDVRQAIDDHVRLLLAWNEAINLTAIRDPADIAIRHVVDSLAALRWFDAHPVDRLLDLGSGAGFPGMPLGAAMHVDDLLLVDSIGKKVRFLEAAIGVARKTLSAAVGWRAFAGRVEALGRDPRHRGQWPAVTARAVAAMADLVELSFPLLVPGGHLIAWKAGDPGDRSGLGAEIEIARRAVESLGGGAITVGEPLGSRDPSADALAAIGDHRLIVVRRATRRLDDRWPRDPAERRRRPWS
jgi:16S rRNA (guanine527-N7)-methyltransferase